MYYDDDDSEYLFDDSEEQREPDYPDFTFDDSEEPEEPMEAVAPKKPIEFEYPAYSDSCTIFWEPPIPPKPGKIKRPRGLYHVSYSLPKYFNAERMYRARPAEHYDIFWEMIRKTAYSLSWRIRYAPKPPCTLYDFNEGIPPAKIHNFIHQHKRRFAWKDEESELALKTRRCKFLAGSKAKYPCHQRQICPFCLCEDSAVPFYKTIRGCLEQTEFSKPMLCHLTFFAPDKIENYIHAERVAEKILRLRQEIRDARVLRAIKDKWFRPCLVGDDNSSLQAALRCLLIVDRSEIDRVIYRLDRFTGFTKSTFRAYVPSPLYIKRKAGWFYQYSKWLLRTQVSEIAAYLHTRLYNTRVKL